MEKSAVTLMREILRNLAELEDRFGICFTQSNGVYFGEVIEETLEANEEE